MSGNVSWSPGATTKVDPPHPSAPPEAYGRLWPVVLVVAVLGLIAGSYPIANTSIGWHLSSGHWILDHGEVPRTDPFSITSENAEWLDHEWGFQVIVALTEDLAGDSGLGLLRALLVSGRSRSHSAGVSLKPSR